MASSSSLSSPLSSPRSILSSSDYASPSAALEAVGARPRQVQHRPTKQASYELCNHAKAYLEGGQFASGFDFLYSLLAAGTSISTPAQPHIGLLAPPAYIAFAASLIVQPRYTTQTTSRDVVKGPDAALRYIRCILTTLEGPAYQTIRKAFSFPEEHARRRGVANRIAAEILSPGKGGDVERIAGPAANEENLWIRAEDFWHIVGWAFNCSIAHKKRWDRWKLWLDVMLDFLELDWKACVKRSEREGEHQGSILQESLLWRYLMGNTKVMNRGLRRRIVKAIFAMATSESLKDFCAIWPNEMAGPKRKKADDRPLGKVDFETGDMGHYDSDEDMPDEPEEAGYDSGSEGSTSALSDDGDTHNLDEALEPLGGMDAIELRQRFVALLARVAEGLPEQFTTLEDLFDTTLEDFVQLRTSTFNVLLSTSKLSPVNQFQFDANLLHHLVTRTPPDYFHHHPKQADFETTLLSLQATRQSIAHNTMVSLSLERMVLYMMDENLLTATDELRMAMETGIKARKSVKSLNKSKLERSEEEEEAEMLLEASSDRLWGLLELLDMAGE